MDEKVRIPVIAVGVDGSEHSKPVLRWAARHAEDVHGRLRVVLAWHFPELPGYIPHRVESELSAAAEKLVNDLVNDTVDADVTSVEQVIHEGSPARLLLEAARDADLLVLGRHGHGHVDGKVLGSVVTRCALQAPCPVVVVPVEQPA